jgi:hypothetical protein
MMNCAFFTGIGVAAAAFSGCTVTFWSATESVPTGNQDGRIEHRKFLSRVQFLDLVPTHSEIAQRITVEGNLAGYRAYKFSVNGVAVAQNQSVGRRIRGWLALGRNREADGHCGEHQNWSKFAKENRTLHGGDDGHK